jgi:hypothetical protein
VLGTGAGRLVAALAGCLARLASSVPAHRLPLVECLPSCRPTCDASTYASPRPSLHLPASFRSPAGILAGAVSITAPCALVQSYGAVIIGAVGAIFYSLSSKLLLRQAARLCLAAWPVPWPAAGVQECCLFSGHPSACPAPHNSSAPHTETTLHSRARGVTGLAFTLTPG